MHTRKRVHITNHENATEIIVWILYFRRYKKIYFVVSALVRLSYRKTMDAACIYVHMGMRWSQTNGKLRLNQQISSHITQQTDNVSLYCGFPTFFLFKFKTATKTPSRSSDEGTLKFIARNWTKHFWVVKMSSIATRHTDSICQSSINIKCDDKMSFNVANPG